MTKQWELLFTARCGGPHAAETPHGILMKNHCDQYLIDYVSRIDRRLGSRQLAGRLALDWPAARNTAQLGSAEYVLI